MVSDGRGTEASGGEMAGRSPIAEEAIWQRIIRVPRETNEAPKKTAKTTKKWIMGRGSTDQSNGRPEMGKGNGEMKETNSKESPDALRLE